MFFLEAAEQDVLRESRRDVVRYWERRRLVYNAVLLGVAVVAYFLTSLLNTVGDTSFAMMLFGMSAIGANLCYSLCYTAEFMFGSDDPTSDWVSTWRPRVFTLGLWASVPATWLVSAQIGRLEYAEAVRSFLAP